MEKGMVRDTSSGTMGVLILENGSTTTVMDKDL